MYMFEVMYRGKRHKVCFVNEINKNVWFYIYGGTSSGWMWVNSKECVLIE